MVVMVERASRKKPPYLPSSGRKMVYFAHYDRGGTSTTSRQAVGNDCITRLTSCLRPRILLSNELRRRKIHLTREASVALPLSSVRPRCTRPRCLREVGTLPSLSIDPRDKMVLNTFPAIKVFCWVKGSTNMLERLSGVANCDQVLTEVTKCDQIIQ